METPKESLAKRLRNQNDFIMETSNEDEPMAKRRRTGNLDGQIGPIIQEKQQIIENIKDLQKSTLKRQLEIQAQIAENDSRIEQLEDQLKELMGPLLETMLPDEILLKILGYLSSSDVLRNVARVSKQFKKLSEDPFLIKTVELHNGLKTDDQVKGCLEVLKTSKNLKIFSFDLNWDFALPGYKKFLKALPTFNNQQASPRTRSMTREDRTPPNHQTLEEFCIRGHYWINEQYKDDYISLFGAVHK